MNDFGLDAGDMEAIHSILAAHPEVETAILYGSRATGRFRPGSDIDLVLAGKNLTDQTILDIRAALSDSNSPYLFDIVAENAVSDENLKRDINATGKFFYTTKKSVWPGFAKTRGGNVLLFVLPLTCLLAWPVGFGVYIVMFFIPVVFGGTIFSPSEFSNFVTNALGFHLWIFYPLLGGGDLTFFCFLLGCPYAFALSLCIAWFRKRAQSRLN